MVRLLFQDFRFYSNNKFLQKSDVLSDKSCLAMNRSIQSGSRRTGRLKGSKVSREEKWISLLKLTIEFLILVFWDYFKLTKTALICLSFCQNHLTLKLVYINNVNKGTGDNTHDLPWETFATVKLGEGKRVHFSQKAKMAFKTPCVPQELNITKQWLKELTRMIIHLHRYHLNLNHDVSMLTSSVHRNW